jgi:hypothetical protein
VYAASARPLANIQPRTPMRAVETATVMLTMTAARASPRDSAHGRTLSQPKRECVGEMLCTGGSWPSGGRGSGIVSPHRVQIIDPSPSRPQERPCDAQVASRSGLTWQVWYWTRGAVPLGTPDVWTGEVVDRGQGVTSAVDQPGSWSKSACSSRRRSHCLCRRRR